MEEKAAADGTHEGEPPKGNIENRNQCSCIDVLSTSLLGSCTGEPLAKVCFENELHLYLMEPVINRRKGGLLQQWGPLH